METANATVPFRLTLNLPLELACAIDADRMALADKLRTKISVNQHAIRLLTLGLEAAKA